jgi:hypothetical protein
MGRCRSQHAGRDTQPTAPSCCRWPWQFKSIDELAEQAQKQLDGVPSKP